MRCSGMAAREQRRQNLSELVTICDILEHLSCTVFATDPERQTIGEREGGVGRGYGVPVLPHLARAQRG